MTTKDGKLAKGGIAHVVTSFSNDPLYTQRAAAQGKNTAQKFAQALRTPFSMRLYRTMMENTGMPLRRATMGKRYEAAKEAPLEMGEAETAARRS